jgi:uncharacterized delta-60 repeat protein
MQKLNRPNGLGVLSELCAFLIAALLCAPKQLPGATTGPPTIDYPPRSQEVILYQQAAFGVIADGTPPLEYQWLKNGAPIPGATNDQIVIRQTQFSDDGRYSVIVSNAEGSAASTEAQLAVKVPRAGDLDYSFPTGGSVNGAVRSLAVQPDGKVLIAGEFTTVHDAARGRIARLNADGSTDHAFMDEMSGANGAIHSIAVQHDRKVLIGGGFTSVNGVPRANIARLNRDGSLDHEFDCAVSGAIYTVVFDGNGKILIGGSFDAVNGFERGHIARLNPDGTLDTSLQPIVLGGQSQSTPAGDGVIRPRIYAIALQTDGKLLIGGSFAAINGVTRDHIARLDADGTLDSTSYFTNNVVFGAAGRVTSILMEDNGNALVGGVFSAYRNNDHTVVARVYATGGFVTFPNASRPSISSVTVAVQNDGKILVAGPLSHIVRLNSDGTWHSNFYHDSLGINGVTSSIWVQHDDKILVGGWFSGSRSGVARLNADATLDNAFQNGPPFADGLVSSFAEQCDGKILLGGYFTMLHGAKRSRIARINSDGTLDSDFQSELGGADHDVFSIELQSDGKVLVCGRFSRMNGAVRKAVARLNSDGTLDTMFQNAEVLSSGSSIGEIRDMEVQNDGRVLIVGWFLSVNGTGRTNIARLNPDGSLDGSFQSAASVGTVNALVLQGDGRILIAGTFSKVNGEERNGLARLNADGSLDESFVSPISSSALAVQADGKILVGIHRLNPDGSLDETFHAADISGSANSVAVQSDGRIVMSGNFTVNGESTGILRRHPDGSLDESFSSDQTTYRVVIQKDGKLLITGVPRRLWGTDALPVVKQPISTGTGFALNWHAIPQRTYRVEYKSSLAEERWTDLPGEVQATSHTASKMDSSAGNGQRFYRVVRLP